MSLLLLASRLSKSGHTPELFRYSALIETHAGIVVRLVTRLRCLATQGDEVGLVGHSFGGLLLREALAVVPDLRVKHLVMLATPNRQPRLAARVYTRLPFRILRGSCGQCLADSTWFRSLSVPTVPYTTVAGTGGWRGGWVPFRGEPNDGALAVSETMASDNDQPVLVPARHTFIMNRACVHRLIIERLGGVGCRARASRQSHNHATSQRPWAETSAAADGGPGKPSGSSKAIEEPPSVS